MSRRALLTGVAFAVFGVAAAGCGTERTITGSGHIVSRAISVPAFTQLDAEQTFEVHLSVGAAGRVILRADDNILPELDVRVSGDTLQLKLQGDVSTRQATIRADVAVPALEKIEASGASQVEGRVAFKEATIDLSGASRARLSGSADKLRVDASGASGLDSPGLTARSLEIDLSGASTAELTVIESLSADLSGASSLRYRGSPEVTHRDVSGGSALIHL